LAGNIPLIRRAREYHLYDFKGRRYLDCYLSGGRAILGHTPNRITTVIKNSISKGLIADYPSIYQTRLYKALSLFFPEYGEFRVYRSFLSAVKAVSSYLGGATEGFLYDPASQGRERAGVKKVRAALWRPFLEGEEGAVSHTPEVLLPLIPFPGELAPQPVCFLKPCKEDVPESDTVSGFILSAVIKSLFELKRVYKSLYSEEIFKFFECELWKRKGPYLIPMCREEEYLNFFNRFLEEGILISPFYSKPSIVPARFTQGEVKYIKKIGRLQWV